MTDPYQNTILYQNTVRRMEHDISFVDASAGWASISISLRRIADCLEQQEIRCSEPVWVRFMDWLFGWGR